MLESWYLLSDARWFTVQYGLVSSTCKTTRCNMTQAVERDVKQQINKAYIRAYILNTFMT